MTQMQISPIMQSRCRVTDEQLETAYHWLCRQRQYYPDNADIWSLRFTWAQDKDALLKVINQGKYQFSPLNQDTMAEPTSD